MKFSSTKAGIVIMFKLSSIGWIFFWLNSSLVSVLINETCGSQPKNWFQPGQFICYRSKHSNTSISLWPFLFLVKKGGEGEYELFWLLLLTQLRFLLGRCFSIYSLAAACFIEHHVPLESCYTASYASLFWWFWIDDYFLINTSVDWQWVPLYIVGDMGTRHILIPITDAHPRF